MISEFDDQNKNILQNRIDNIRNFINQNPNVNNFYKRYIAKYPNKDPFALEKYDNNKLEEFEEKYGFKYIPNIIYYKEEQISKNLLESNYTQIRNNKFYISLFKGINFDIEEIINAYNQFNSTRAKGFLDKVNNEINIKLKVLSDKFNKLYAMEDCKYLFELDLESEHIYFKMSRGDDPIVLENQSTGFKWFFNLYFNLLCSSKLEPGDIIVSDEFATSLHPEGQKELRRVIKEFGIKNDILFVIATQSPFLADVDNFDELRVITL